MTLERLRQLILDQVATSRRPIIWWSMSEEQKQLTMAIQKLAIEDTDSLNKLLNIYNSMPPVRAEDGPPEEVKP